MTAITIGDWVPEIKKDMSELERAIHLGTVRAFDRMGVAVEHRAIQIAASFSGEHRRSIHKEDSYDPATNTLSIRVVADSPHSIFVELGFRGHFVPFHVADDLYRWAIQRAGWRVPAPGEVKNPKPGRRYLIPKGRKSPSWGMFISGRAQPALQPALNELVESGLRDRILQEEIHRAIRGLR